MEVATWQSIIFLQDLIQKFQLAMPDVTGDAREQLLLYQFVAGLPASVNKKLQAACEITRIETAMERARLLMVLKGVHGRFNLSYARAA